MVVREEFQMRVRNGGEERGIEKLLDKGVGRTQRVG